MKIIEVRDFSFRYANGSRESLSHVSLDVEEGTFNVLCGKSGCGKSTLLRQLKSDLAPFGSSSGKICYYGRDLKEVGHRQQSQEIGYVLQNPENQIVTDKVWHELAFGLESLGYDTPTIRLRVAEMASYFGIHQWFYKNVSELSGGQKQLLNLAAIMAMHPKLLILDEPTSQLDPIAASDFLETVRKINRDIGTTIILTEHRLQDVIPWADRVYVMDKGSLLTQGAPREIGEFLKREHHGMFLSMPVPMQVYAEVENNLPCPLTVREGRNWITQVMAAASDTVSVCEESYFCKNKQKLQKKLNTVRDKLLPGSKSSMPPAIEVKDVWFRYEKDGKDVVQDLNLEVKQGEFYALVGGNGTGKSTTLSLISRVRAPYRGKILLNGIDIRKYGSQGQQRTAALSLKLAQIQLMREVMKESPILLLDDVLSELDSNRKTYLLESIKDTQTIITCTGLDEFISKHLPIQRMFQIKAGKIVKEN